MTTSRTKARILFRGYAKSLIIQLTSLWSRVEKLVLPQMVKKFLAVVYVTSKIHCRMHKRPPLEPSRVT
jgi:hypothetical protein